jgi:DNA repair exonuclease SbcCD ATPase subunit
MIYFKTVRWQNFLSTGNQWTEIQLNKAQSTLIVGENGAGKSTMLDAISFGLYGKPYRNINKPQLVNSITTKRCVVEVEFSSKGKEYMIRRGIKPNVFEIFCDGKLLDQHASVREYQEYLEKNVLKLNHKSFTQIVVIGSANFIPFMQMKVWERRDVIEDLLDIEIFTKMNNLLKEKINKNKEDVIEAKYQINMLEQRISLTKKHLNEIMSMQKSDRDAKLKKVEELETKLNDLRLQYEGKANHVKHLHESIKDRDTIKGKQRKLNELKMQLSSKVQNIQSQIEFFKDHDDCPTCHQSIDEEFKEDHICEQQEKQLEIKDGIDKMTDHFNEVERRLNEISAVQDTINSINQIMMNLNSEMTSTQNGIKELNQSLEEVPQVQETDDLDELNTTLGKNKEKHETLLREKERYEIASSLLKDGGIKSKIIKQYVPIINKLMNKYLAAMEFFVQFELDEQFNEKIKSRFRDEFTYDSFSEGEKMRIDLSLLFTWRAVAKLRNSVTTNLLIMDEVFDSSLDTTGTDEFLKLITQLTQDTNVFVISHKGDQLFDKFHSNIRFEKVKNFSQIAA